MSDQDHSPLRSDDLSHPAALPGVDREAIVVTVRRLRQLAENSKDLHHILAAEAAIDLIDRLALASAEAPHPAVGWRPIATAPKDGTLVLVGRVDSPAAFSAYWQEDGGNGAGWADGSTDRYEDLIIYVGLTHWMPLPAAPTDQPASKGGGEPLGDCEANPNPPSPDHVEAVAEWLAFEAGWHGWSGWSYHESFRAALWTDWPEEDVIGETDEDGYRETQRGKAYHRERAVHLLQFLNGRGS